MIRSRNSTLIPQLFESFTPSKIHQGAIKLSDDHVLTIGEFTKNYNGTFTHIYHKDNLYKNVLSRDTNENEVIEFIGPFLRPISISRSSNKNNNNTSNNTDGSEVLVKIIISVVTPAGSYSRREISSAENILDIHRGGEMFQSICNEPVNLDEQLVLEFLSVISENLEFHARIVNGVSVIDYFNWILRFVKSLKFDNTNVVKKLVEVFSLKKIRENINVERKFYPHTHPDKIYAKTKSEKKTVKVEPGKKQPNNNTSIFDSVMNFFGSCCCCAPPVVPEIPSEPMSPVQNIEEIFVIISPSGALVDVFDSISRIPDIIKSGFQVQSKFKGTTKFASHAPFANVIGSTNDPKVGGQSWIGLWRSQFGDEHYCTSLNFMVNCGTALVGGHVITGTVAKTMPVGSTVYIMPICKAHNNNNNVWMEAITNQNAVVLSDYLR